MKYRSLNDFPMDWLGLIGFYRVLPGFTGFLLISCVWQGCRYRCGLVLLKKEQLSYEISTFEWFSEVWLGFTGFYRVLPGFTGFSLISYV